MSQDTKHKKRKLSAPKSHRAEDLHTEAHPAIKIEVKECPTEQLRQMLSDSSTSPSPQEHSSEAKDITVKAHLDTPAGASPFSPEESTTSDCSSDYSYSASPAFEGMDEEELAVDVSSLWCSGVSPLDEDLDQSVAMCSSWEPGC